MTKRKLENWEEWNIISWRKNYKRNIDKVLEEINKELEEGSNKSKEGEKKYKNMLRNRIKYYENKYKKDVIVNEMLNIGLDKVSLIIKELFRDGDVSKKNEKYKPMKMYKFFKEVVGTIKKRAYFKIHKESGRLNYGYVSVEEYNWKDNLVKAKTLRKFIEWLENYTGIRKVYIYNLIYKYLYLGLKE